MFSNSSSSNSSSTSSSSLSDTYLTLPHNLASRVIVHIDLDAFYTQVETRRLGVPPHLPLAVQQWDGLIAVNYPARSAGVKKNGTRWADAMKSCPNLELVHVATIDQNGVESDGSDLKGALSSGKKDSSKVSLSRYRIASAGIFRLLVEVCGESRVEKASVDEAFIDVTEMATTLLRSGTLREAGSGKASSGGWISWQLGRDASSCSRPELARRVIHAVAVQAQLKRWALISRDGNSISGASDTSSSAASVPSSRDLSGCADAQADADAAATHSLASIDLDSNDRNDHAFDTGLSTDSHMDVLIAAGGVIASYIRYRIYASLGYTSSAGIAVNKMLAKLGSGRNKPNKQTLLPMSSVAGFMAALPLQSIRFLGGKLGDLIVSEVLRSSSSASSSSASSVALLSSFVSHGGNGDDASLSTLGTLAGDAGPYDFFADDYASALIDTAEDSSRASNASSHAASASAAPAAPSMTVSSGAASAASGPRIVTAGDAQALSMKRLQTLFPDKALYLYRVVRGVDEDELKPRTKPLSLNCAKQFISKDAKSFEAVCRLATMLASELADRLADDEVEWKREARNLVLQYSVSRKKGSSESHSKSCAMPPPPRSAKAIIDAAVNLLRHACNEEEELAAGGLDRSFGASSGGGQGHSSSSAPSSASSSGYAAAASSNKGKQRDPAMFKCSYLALKAGGFIDFEGSNSSLLSFFSRSTAAAASAADSMSSSSSAAPASNSSALSSLSGSNSSTSSASTARAISALSSSSSGGSVSSTTAALPSSTSDAAVASSKRKGKPLSVHAMLQSAGSGTRSPPAAASLSSSSSAGASSTSTAASELLATMFKPKSTGAGSSSSSSSATTAESRHQPAAKRRKKTNSIASMFAAQASSTASSCAAIDGDEDDNDVIEIDSDD